MRRSSFLGLAVAVVLCSATVSSAWAQGGGGFGGGRRGGGMFGRGGLQMLSIPEVQKELKMTPAEVTKATSKQDDVRQQMRDLFQSGGNPMDMSDEERAAMQTKMRGIQDKAVADVLDATQIKRFHQLELQQQGASAIARPDIAAALKLTDDQKKKVADIQEDANSQRRELFTGGNPMDMTQEERTAMFTKMQGLQKATDEKLAAVLTDAQKAQWKDMLGAPFTFPAMGPGRGGFGGGRGGFGGPGGGGGGRRGGGGGGGAAAGA